MQKILVIDDDINFQNMLSVLLERHNLTANFIFDGLDGIEEAKNNNYDLIITDLHMPDISGLEVIETLKANEKCPPIIVVSGGNALRNKDMGALNEAENLDVFSLFEKPFNHEDFINSVQSALNLEH